MKLVEAIEAFLEHVEIGKNLVVARCACAVDSSAAPAPASRLLLSPRNLHGFAGAPRLIHPAGHHASL